MFVVETQKTRGGKDSNGGDTRPYRFGEFDILAVSLHPSTDNWAKFRYSLGRSLLADPSVPTRIFKYQAVPMQPNDLWTDDIEECIEWLRSGRNSEQPPPASTIQLFVET
jgi:hypothetical protein